MAAPRCVVIRVLDEARGDKAAFRGPRAWSCKYVPTDLNGTRNEVAVGALELCNEGTKRIQYGGAVAWALSGTGALNDPLVAISSARMTTGTWLAAQGFLTGSAARRCAHSTH